MRSNVTISREMLPDEIRQILGQNLRRLLQREESVVSFCQKVGLNRTQFNRYVSGEAHPRPDVLHKICRYFGVDARILLQPLDELLVPPVATPRPDLDFLIQDNLKKTTIALGPDDGFTGMYRFWRRAFTETDQVVTGLAQISLKSGVMVLRFREPRKVGAALPGRRELRQKDLFVGVCLKTDGGMTAIIRRATGPENDNVFGVIVIDRAEAPLFDLFSGAYTLTRAKTLFSTRTTGVALERLPNDCQSWREVARRTRVQPLDSVPAAIRRIINVVPPEQ